MTSASSPARTVALTLRSSKNADKSASWRGGFGLLVEQVIRAAWDQDRLLGEITSTERDLKALSAKSWAPEYRVEALRGHLAAAVRIYALAY